MSFLICIQTIFTVEANANASKHENRLLISVGLKKRELTKIIMIETASVCISAILTGVILGLSIFLGVRYQLEIIMELPPKSFFYQETLILFAGTLLLTIFLISQYLK